MIEQTQGNILKADTDTLVNPVNCVGVMGRGLALQFRKAFPENYDAYKTACDAGQVRPGRLFVHETGRMIAPQYIINFPTKDHWRSKSQLSFIEDGLEALVAEVRRLGLKSIAIPPLGCGLGGLNWSDVRQRIEHAFEGWPDLHVFLYEPRST